MVWLGQPQLVLCAVMIIQSASNAQLVMIANSVFTLVVMILVAIDHLQHNMVGVMCRYVLPIT